MCICIKHHTLPFHNPTPTPHTPITLSHSNTITLPISLTTALPVIRLKQSNEFAIDGGQLTIECLATHDIPRVTFVPNWYYNNTILQEHQYLKINGLVLMIFIVILFFNFRRFFHITFYIHIFSFFEFLRIFISISLVYIPNYKHNILLLFMMYNNYI